MDSKFSGKVWIASDHAGWSLKEAVKVYLTSSLGLEVEDLGCHSADSVDYPSYAHDLASRMGRMGDRGILICHTGIGMSMVVNRYDDLRGALCRSEEEARLSRAHNDAQVLCLGSMGMEASHAHRVVRCFLETPFTGGRHARRVGLINMRQGDFHR